MDLFLYARGGSIAAACRIIALIRELADDLNIIVPYKCHNAAALMALGADRLLMGPLGELTPIDPWLGDDAGRTGGLQLTPRRLAGDLMSAVALLRSGAGDTLQPLPAAVELRELGEARRITDHIRSAARALLATRREKTGEQEAQRIVDALTVKMNPHVDRIDRAAAREIGLKLFPSRGEWEEPVEALYLRNEHLLRLGEPISPEEEMEAIIDVKITENLPLAVLESGELRHVFRSNLSLRKVRQVPSDPEIAVNLSMKLSPEEDPARFSQEMQNLLANLKKQAARNIQTLVQRELQRQSPVVDLDVTLYGGKWVEES